MVTHAGSLLKPLDKTRVWGLTWSNTVCAPKLFFLNGERFAVLESRADCESAQLIVPVSIMLTSRFGPYWQCVALAAPN